MRKEKLLKYLWTNNAKMEQKRKREKEREGKAGREGGKMHAHKRREMHPS
jgi:hypothetical protein